MASEREQLSRTLRYSSLATLIGLVFNYALFCWLHTPLWTDRIAEWIMARTPSRYAVPILQSLGAWAKPWAATGALATLGFAIFLARLVGSLAPKVARAWLISCIALLFGIGLARAVSYESLLGFVSFWVPATIAAIALREHGPSITRSTLFRLGFRTATEPRALAIGRVTSNSPGTRAIAPHGRRGFLAAAATYGLPVVMGSGTVGVAVESYFRNREMAKNAATPVELFPFVPALDRERFASGLTRKAVTPAREFYGMSKNTVDPAVDPHSWRLAVTMEGRPMRSYRYAELLSLPRQRRYETLRCISNTLQSDLMGTAEWAGVHLSQLVDRRILPPEMVEAAFIGVDGHDDSLQIDYAFGEESLLALGMNGKTLNRTHGFPVRLLAPRYYGCRNVKWLREIRFVTKPYYGTWQRLGYTKEPVIHIASHVDHIERDGRRVRCGGVSFAGDQGILGVRVRVNRGLWSPATLEPPLSKYTWTRWWAETTAQLGDTLEVNAQNCAGKWQELAEAGPFPTGMAGPTFVKVNV